jgi:hypothetical protein
MVRMWPPVLQETRLGTDIRAVYRAVPHPQFLIRDRDRLRRDVAATEVAGQ